MGLVTSQAQIVFDFKKWARKLYKNSNRIQVYPVSKGTFTVHVDSGYWGQRDRSSKTFSGLTSLAEVEQAVADALDWSVSREPR